MVTASTFMMRPQAFLDVFFPVMAAPGGLCNIDQYCKIQGPNENQTSIHLVEFGCQTVSELICMGWFLKGL